jgi:hypothetical protein
MQLSEDSITQAMKILSGGDQLSFKIKELENKGYSLNDIMYIIKKSDNNFTPNSKRIFSWETVFNFIVPGALVALVAYSTYYFTKPVDDDQNDTENISIPHKSLYSSICSDLNSNNIENVNDINNGDTSGFETDEDQLLDSSTTEENGDDNLADDHINGLISRQRKLTPKDLNYLADDHINGLISRQRKLTPKDLNYVIDLLEKQQFTQELIIKQITQGTPEWANDLLIIQKDLVNEIGKLNRNKNSFPVINANENKHIKSTTVLPTDKVLDSNTINNSDETSNELSKKEVIPQNYKEKLNRLYNAFELFLEENSPSDDNKTNSSLLKEGCGMLTMYLNHIIQQPEIPR